jgi:parvulin-like peptidyl-prolyl isomerase
MKLHFVVLLALLVSQGFAQAAPQQQSKPLVSSESAAGAASSKPVAPDAPVISVAGICQKPSAKGECQTVITRAEFEKLMSLLSRQRNGQAQESVPPEAKRQLAVQYSRLLLFGNLAEKQGLQNTPEGKELIHFLRLQALTEELARTLQQKSAPTPEEARSFYDHNPERYTEWHLQRIVVPLSAGAGNQQKAELKKLAEDFRQRASAGGDFDALQEQAFQKAGIKNPPRAKLVLMPNTPLPEAHAAVYKLKPGELSPVIEDSDGFYIYKLDSSRLTPFEQNKAGIQSFLAGKKAQQAIQRVLESNKVTLNSKYFEPVQQNSAPKASSLQPADGAAQAEMR